MDFINLSQSRRSIRGFAQQAIPKEDLVKLLEAARSAPSAGNCQPWYFYVVSSQALRAEIVDKTCPQAFILDAPVLFVACADIKRSERRYGKRGRSLYCLQDTAAAIQNILLCAESLGLGACWCGAFDEDKLSKILRLEKDMRPVALIPVGYPACAPGPAPRRPLSEIAEFIERTL